MCKKILSLVLAIFFIAPITFSYGCKNKTPNITSYDISVSLDGQTLYGKQTVNYFNDTETAISELKFNIFGNAFRKDAKFSPVSANHIAQSYPHGINYGGMQINSVYSEQKPLNFSVGGQDENVLCVVLEREIFPQEKVSVTIDFTLNLAKIVARTGINDNTINLANFYPILCARDQNGFYECVYYPNGDPFYSDCANYNVEITADKKFVIAASGKKTSQTDNGENVTATYKIDNARSFAFVLSENFQVLSDNSTGVEINYFYYDDASPQLSMEYAVKSMKYFNDAFGEYVYKNYSFVQTEFVQGGMEFPALTMISDDLEEKAYGEVIVHETAHQWWQTAVGNNEVEYGFLDEGLAEYSVVLFYENHPEYGMNRKDMINSAQGTFKVFCTVSDKVFGKVDTSMIRSLKDFKGEYEYVNIAYIKSCLMYDYLRETIGDKRFFKGLKNYYQQYKFKNAAPYDLAGVYEKIGADTNGFFQTFFDGKEII